MDAQLVKSFKAKAEEGETAGADEGDGGADEGGGEEQ
jgi:hypothetical protein